MLVFSTAKINLGLRVTGKRSDGFHSIDSIFFLVAVRDAVEVIRSTTPGSPLCRFSFRGDIPDNKPGMNLCEKACYLLSQEFNLPPSEIYLQKNIPVGAGLGGGSGNAAAVLVAMNELYAIGLTQQQLVERAMTLGSDCGFFIYGKPCYVQGRGEIITPVELSLKGFTMVIVNPGIHVSTAQAYAGISPAEITLTTKQIVHEKPIDQWKNILVNDFEKVIFKLHPEIENIKTTMYAHGAVYASMSGSGSSVYGIFNNSTPQADNALKEFKNYRTFRCLLS